MKRLTLRWKLTLLYTFFMMILTIGMLGILFSLSSNAILDSAHRELKDRVWEAFDELEWEDGELEIDSDLLETEEGVYLSVYDADGNMVENFKLQGYDWIKQNQENAQANPEEEVSTDE